MSERPRSRNPFFPLVALSSAAFAITVLALIVGAILAGLLFPALGLHFGSGIVAQIIAATVGAVILLVVARLVKRGGRW